MIQPSSAENIRKKVLIPLGITLAALLLLFLAILSALRYQETRRDLALQQQTVQNLFRHLLAGQTSLLVADARFLSQRTELRQAMAAGDRAALLTAALPYYENLILAQGFTHLYFHTVDGHNFLRVHRPQQHGDHIDRFTLRRAMESGEIAHGLELGPLGTYTQRMVLPWRQGEELLGYIEIGEGIDSLIKRLRDSARVELMITLWKDGLQRTAWEESMQRAGRTPRWEDFDQLVVVDSTLTTPPADLARYLPKKGQTGRADRPAQLASDDRSYQVALLPLHDAAGLQIGNFLVFHDISDKLQVHHRSLLITVFACLLLGGGLFLSCWLILGRTERHLALARAVLVQEMERTRRVNVRLETEIAEHQRTELALQQVRAGLEETVQKRTVQLQKALQETHLAHDRVSAILRSVNDALFVTDHQGRMLLLNKRAELLLGIGQEEAGGRPIAELITHPALLEQVRMTLNGTAGSSFDVEMTSESQAPVSLRVRTSKVESARGAIRGMIFLAQDISLEMEMNRIKSEFISTAAHELNTPLATILGFAELLMNNDDFSPQERQEFIVHIYEKTDHLSQLVSELLDLSRIEAGHPLTMHKQDCLVANLFASALQHYQNVYGERLHLELQDPDLQLCVDRMKINQVMENLLSNAFKYSPQGGRVRIGGTPSPAGYTVTISDDGIGMTAEQVKRIFDKFYRGDASNTAIPGTGLGMTIVRNIVVAHGGSIVVESVPAQGTTVRFTLPWAAVDDEQPAGLRSSC